MPEPASDLVHRYKENYGLREDSPLTEEMIHRHWDLERALTRRLLDSDPDERRDVFAACYTELYRELSWLNRFVVEKSEAEKRREFIAWADAIGPDPVRIYEVGSGRGELLEHLADIGHDCTGSEITEERGEALLGRRGERIRWHAGDGVRLTLYEPEGAYDVVITNQLIEHLHPEDLEAHFAEVRAILKPDGRYLLSTPHRLTGPHDVSKIFRRPSAEGMHLKEYTYRELFGSLRRSGFRDVQHAGQRRRIRRMLGEERAGSKAERALLRISTGILLLAEGILQIVPRPLRPTVARRMHRIGIFSENIFLVASR
ncbi:MAG: methyltransferase domain-containing protein [Candidatus Eisenbacteria bacterium]|nr:methyltransferase domain-containing protein [Candidatus Latescibacterota bacterium]MBD3301623.1 methyltransferase domain-containing protein [Candidatus Eisenbacteria bacterium]